ncbi:MAG: hypothetical protein BGO98_07745 [Myxococcales bacterium 68-20]|nr:MAG: hypothetical protein BGO98_07745 [Myxococcales bacterium 68-20]
MVFRNGVLRTCAGRHVDSDPEGLPPTVEGAIGELRRQGEPKVSARSSRAACAVHGSVIGSNASRRPIVEPKSSARGRYRHVDGTRLARPGGGGTSHG